MEFSTDMRPLEGVRVVELGLYAAGPSCGAVLADWGADVIKLEPVGGERSRSRGTVETGATTRPLNPRYEMHNRGKRSIAVDLSSSQGLSVVLQLVDNSDVFVTNMRNMSLRGVQLDSEALRARNTRLIYGQVSAYGLGHAYEDRGSFDHGAFWSRSGAASLFQQPGSAPPQPTGGMGDRVAGSILAGGIAAALFARDKRGKGEHVTVSLSGTAAWMLGSDLSDLLVAGEKRHVTERERAPIPTLNCYQDQNGQWFWLQLMEPDRKWSGLLRALESPVLEEDSRFCGGDPRLLAAHREELVALLDRIFATRTLSEWEERLEREGILLEPVLSLEQAVVDPINQAAEPFVTGTAADGAVRTMVRPPCRFTDDAVVAGVSAPWPGEHTADILREHGISDSDVQKMHASGSVRVG
jgi:crotonobetainyl-CoA:carnitine CoA-transferase CaiB-like acyl-CoA transferase